MAKILVTASHFNTLCLRAKEKLLSAGHEIVCKDNDSPYSTFDELKPLVGDIDAAIVGMDQWNDQVFAIAPHLKVIARFGVGVDNISLDDAKKRGIVVTNALGCNANAVAELVVGMIFVRMRNLCDLVASTREGQWQRFVGRELKGKSVGLLGFGDIAQRVAKKLMGFDVVVRASDIKPNYDRAKELNVEIVDEHALLQSSDILSVHIPSTVHTRYYINDVRLGHMKGGAFLINTARGAVVDTEALCDAVERGHLGGAALDVFETEPLPQESRVLRIPNIICTPHTGAETAETYDQVSLCNAQAVLDVFDGREPLNRLA